MLAPQLTTLGARSGSDGAWIKAPPGSYPLGSGQHSSLWPRTRPEGFWVRQSWRIAVKRGSTRGPCNHRHRRKPAMVGVEARRNLEGWQVARPANSEDASGNRTAMRVLDLKVGCRSR